jgi:hypothetical protein
MHFTKWAAWVAGIIVVVLSAAPRAQDPVPVVTFSAISDATPTMFFDASLTQVDVTDRNRLVIGFNSGLDLATFRSREFSASTEGFGRLSAMDTIKMNVTAPNGYYIATITYAQQGSGSVSGSGRAAGGTQWVVGDDAVDLKQFSTDPDLSSTIDISARVLTTVPVSVTSSLFVFSTPQLGSAQVAISSADVIVTVLPCRRQGGKGNGGGKNKVCEA